MRKGTNPQKNKLLDLTRYVHQVIIPVYLPEDGDYFKEGLKILELCLTSLFKTVHEKTFITVVNNGSSQAVVKYLNSLQGKGMLHEVVHTDNIGKNNAILKALNGHFYKYITIADADVLFLEGWQNETMNVFQSLPKAGQVGLIPQMKMHGYLSSNVLFDYFFSPRLRFTQVINPEAMKAFYRSLGWGDDYNHNYLTWHLTLQGSNNLRAAVGTGHVVATYKREALKTGTDIEINELLSTKFDREFLDLPGLRKGGYRLTTEANYAFHLGNTLEPWMTEITWSAQPPEFDASKYSYKPLKGNKIAHFIKNHLFRKVLENKVFLHWYIGFKGLPKALVKTPWHE
ncbi:MAG: glycosyltransferase family 2 protein [Aequorivita sp.]|nr:glycosyltransferase family 2 protein [Aequorivita sp.]